MKTLGILGGVGPQTTSKIYLSVIDLVRKGGEDKYPPILIYNLPFPFIIEDEVIIQGINSDKMLPYLLVGAKILERAGADFGILPCNTLHEYIKDIRESVNFPFLSILEETASDLRSKKIKAVGILATETTIRSKIYENALKDSGIDIVYPTTAEQENIGTIIVGLLKNDAGELHAQKIEAICNSLQEKGAEKILVACTDLQLVTSGMNNPTRFIDTTDILIKASVRELLGK